MPDENQQIEATLADFAIQLVLGRTPALAEHYLGFDLIQGSVNENKTRAAGLLGFRIGQETLSIPVLFLNGRIKGTEVLYLDGPDVFTSNSSQWIDYLLSRDSSMMGTGATPPTPLQQPGAAGMRVFSRAPGSTTKTASPENKEFFNKSAELFWEKIAQVDPETVNFYSRPEFTVKGVLQKLGRKAYVDFMTTLDQNPEVLAKIANVIDIEKELLINEWPADEPKLASVEDTQKFFDNVKTAMDQVNLITIFPSDLISMRKEAFGWEDVSNLIDAETAAESIRDIRHSAPDGASKGIQIGAGIGQGLKNVLGIAAGQVVGFAAAPILGAGIGALANGAFTEDENERRRRRIVGALMGGAVGAAAAPLVSSIGGYAGAKMAAIENLSRADREKCMTDGILFIDKRAAEEKSLAVETEYTNRFSAPKANGFYEILNRGGELQKVFVGLSPFIVEAPKSAIPGSMLLDIESGVYIVPSFSNQIFVRSQLTPAEAVWKEKFTGMTKPSGMETGKHYILVSPSLKVSAPFKVSNKIKAGDEMQFVCETGWAMRYRAVGTNSYPEPAGCCGSSFGSGTGYSGTIVKVVDREDESSVSRVGNITLVPSSWRVQEVYGNSGDLNYDWATSTPFGEESAAAKKERLEKIEKKKKICDRISPGGIATINAITLNKKEFRVTLQKEASGYRLGLEGEVMPSLSRRDVMDHLVSHLNLDTEKAAALIDDVVDSKGVIRFLTFKKANWFGDIANKAYKFVDDAVMTPAEVVHINSAQDAGTAVGAGLGGAAGFATPVLAGGWLGGEIGSATSSDPATQERRKRIGRILGVLAGGVAGIPGAIAGMTGGGLVGGGIGKAIGLKTAADPGEPPKFPWPRGTPGTSDDAIVAWSDRGSGVKAKVETNTALSKKMPAMDLPDKRVVGATTGKTASTQKKIDPIAKFAGHGLNQEGAIYGGMGMPEFDTSMGRNLSGVNETITGFAAEPVPLNNVGDPSQDWRNMDEANWDRMNKRDLDFLMRVADSGSKQVLESSMINLLLKTNRVSSQVDEWIPDLVNALDSKGRMLLLFYWHNQDFASDYGKDEMAEFEDVLLNAIKVEGQLILFLKQRAKDSTHTLTRAFE